MADKKSRFGFGLLVGAVAGALAGIFLAPKTGKQSRALVAKKYKELKEMMEKGEIQEKIKQIFGDVSQESMRIYSSARDNIMKRLDDLKEKAEDIDQDKYKKLVSDVVDDIKDKSKIPTDKLGKLKDYFVEDWNKLMKSSKK